MVTKAIIEFICENRANTSCINALVEHIRLTKSEEILNRVLEMMLLPEETFVNEYCDIENKIDNNKVIDYIKSNNSSEEVIGISNVEYVDVVSGDIRINYTYHQIRWYTDDNLTGTYTYREDYTHKVMNMSTDISTSYQDFNYFTDDILKDN